MFELFEELRNVNPARIRINIPGDEQIAREFEARAQLWKLQEAREASLKQNKGSTC